MPLACFRLSNGPSLKQNRTRSLSSIMNSHIAGCTSFPMHSCSTRRPSDSIMCCSSNGSIREWSNAHEVKNTRFLAQMWEHNGYITDVVSVLRLLLCLEQKSTIVTSSSTSGRSCLCASRWVMWDYVVSKQPPPHSDERQTNIVTGHMTRCPSKQTQVFTAPSLGYCKAHGAPGHSCFMYSVSDDRFLKVRDNFTHVA